MSEAELRRSFDLCLLAIRRDGAMLEPIANETTILRHDTLYVFGKPAQVAQLLHVVEAA
ncbi:TrkA C-terminal domain-containing protein [Microvirga sp. STS02]|nr:TrkA C-terminal domain-containing protein [Hymenobacter negativus]MBR7208368.1 TrkA C-terminal domain-containing protein [Microvirga sp. STS02]